MNIVAITGRLTDNPELKKTTNGTSVCTFSVAVQRPGVKDKTDFLTCVAWQKQAEFVADYFRKGQRIEIVGHITQRSWQDKNGANRYAVEIICKDIRFGESKRESTENGDFTPIDEPDEAQCADDDLPF